MVLFNKKERSQNGMARKISDKLTLFKKKKIDRVGEKCKICGWRKIKSQYSDTCPKCTRENKPGI